jgi:hypothetical protein
MSTVKLVLIIVGSMVAVGVIGMLVIGTLAFGRFKDAQLDAARNQAVQVREVSEDYVQMKRKCPTDIAELKSAGLLAHTEKDPWGASYAITCDEARRITVASPGPDGVAGTADDIRSDS